MKLFLLVVLCALAASAYASFEYDADILKDASFLGQIRERVRLGLEKAANWLREMVDKHKPLLQNLKDKVSDLQQKIKDLASQTGEILGFAVAQVRERVRQLIRDVISKITKREVESVSYAYYGSERLVEKRGARDQGPLNGMLMRINWQTRYAFADIKDLIDKHADVITQGMKDELASLELMWRDVDSAPGADPVDKAAHVSSLVFGLLREINAHVHSNQEVESRSYAYYGSERLVEKRGARDQGPLNGIIERLKGQTQDAFRHIKDLIDKHADVITQGLKDELASLERTWSDLDSAPRVDLLENARYVSRQVFTLLREINARVHANQQLTALYAAEQEEEGFLQMLNRRIRERLQEALSKLKDKLSEIKDGFTEKILPKMEEIRQKISELAQKSGEKLLEAAATLGAKIRELVQAAKDHVLGQKQSSYQAYQGFDIKSAVRTLRDFFSTDDGVKALKDNAEKAKPSSPTGVLIQAYILAASPGGLKDLVQELFKGVDNNVFFQYNDIRDLVKQASAYLMTQEGIAAVRNYAKALQSNHPIVIRLKAMLETATDEAVKAVIQDIFTLQ